MRILFSTIAVVVGLVGAPESLGQTVAYQPAGASLRIGGGAVQDIALSRDGRFLAIAAQYGVWLVDGQTLAELGRLAAREGPASCVAFSPDGALAAGGADGKVDLWDPQKRTLLGTLDHGSKRITALGFSPDGRTVASGDEAGVVKLWTVSSRALAATLSAHTKAVLSVDFAPDGRLLTGGADGVAKLWSTDGKVVFTLTHSGNVRAVFHPDGWQAFTAGGDGKVVGWDLYTGKSFRTFLGHVGEVRGLAWTGQELSSWSKDGRILYWDIGNGQVIRQLFHGAALKKIVFYPTDGGLLGLSESGEMIGRPGSVLFSHTYSVQTVAFTRDGKVVATASLDNAIELWDPATGKHVRTLAGHTGTVRSVSFSPRDTTLASGSEDKTIKLWDVGTGRELRTLSGHTHGVNSVAFSPDGTILASGSGDKTIKLWDVETGRELRTLSGHTGTVYSVVFSPDGKTLASGSLFEIKLWDVGTGKELRALTGHTLWFHSLAFSPDGKTLASGSEAGTVKLWEVETGRELRTLSGHAGSVFSVAFSPDGKTLASGSADRTIKLWDPTTGRELLTSVNLGSAVQAVSFSPDGKVLAAGLGRGAVRLFSMPSLATVRFLSRDSWSLAFSPDGRLLAVGSGSTVCLWDRASGVSLMVLAGHADEVSSVAFSRDGKRLASASLDKTIKLWDVGTGKELSTLSGHLNWVWSVAFSPDGKTLASGSDDRTVKLWEVETGRELRTLSGHTDVVRSVAFSPDGKTLASGSWDKTIKLWDLGTGKELRTLSGHMDRVNSVAFFPDGKTLASGSDDQTIKLWDVETGKELCTLYGHTKEVYAVAVSLDGLHIASGSRGGIVRVWKSSARSPIHVFSLPNSCFSIAFSPDSKELAALTTGMVALWNLTAGDKTLAWPVGQVQAVAVSPAEDRLALSDSTGWVRLWVPATGAHLLSLPEVADVLALSPDSRFLACAAGSAIQLWDLGTRSRSTLSGHNGRVRALLFSPDGRLLASASEDDTARLWDPASGKSLYTLSGHKGDVLAVAFSPDGQRIALASADWTASVWTTSGERLRTLSGHTGPVWAVAFLDGGRKLLTLSEDGTARTWEVATGRLLGVAKAPTRPSAHALSPDAKVLALAREAGLELWDLEAGASFLTRTGQHYGAVTALAYSQGYLVTGGADGTAVVWTTAAVANRPPVPAFSWHVLGPEGQRLLVTPRAGDLVQFDASESKDSDGTITKYEWDLDGDGTFDRVDTKPTLQHRYPAAAKANVTLRVTDDRGATATLTKVVDIGNPPAPPQAAFTFAPPKPTARDEVRFTDTSRDPDGKIVKWEWSFGDGTQAEVQHPIHRYSRSGTYTVTLKVTDSDGLTATATGAVTVVNLPPDARFTFAPTGPEAGEGVNFDASASRDIDGEIQRYEWDFTADGQVDATGAKVTWRFPSPGEYRVTLTVVDGEGATARAEATVAVRVPQPVEIKGVWALVIGISAYAEVRPNLVHAEADARAFAQFLQKTGVPADRVRVLLGKDATLSAVLAGLEWLRRAAGREDLVIVFFAGHGYRGPDDDGDEQDGLDEFLVLYDTKPTAVEKTSIRDDKFGREFIDQLVSEHVLILFDSCYSGGGARGERSMRSGFRPAPGKPADVWGDFALRGRLVLAAAAEDEEAWEDDSLGHGVFTYYLLRGLAGEADRDKDRKVTVHELYEFVAQNVETWVRVNKGQKQRPQLVGEGKRGVVVAVGNAPPEAAFTWTPARPRPGQEVQFDNGSRDPDGTIVGVRWDFGDGMVSAEFAPRHAYKEEGTYVVSLTVTDDQGATATLTKTLVVVRNEPPVAEFTWLPSAPWVTERVVFRNRSRDPDGEIVRCTWDFGDGGTSTERDPSYTYAYPGTYTVRLRVQDSDGAWAEVQKDLVVRLATYIVGVPAEAEKPNLYLVWVAPEDRDGLRVGAQAEVFRREVGAVGVFDVVIAQGTVVAVLSAEVGVLEVRPLLPEPVRPGLFVRWPRG